MNIFDVRLRVCPQHPLDEWWDSDQFAEFFDDAPAESSGNGVSFGKRRLAAEQVVVHAAFLTFLTIGSECGW